jgi:hypothetical protein
MRTNGGLAMMIAGNAVEATRASGWRRWTRRPDFPWRACRAAALPTSIAPLMPLALLSRRGPSLALAERGRLICAMTTGS